MADEPEEEPKADENVERVARAIWGEPDQFGRPPNVSWESMLTSDGRFPGNTEHPLADEYRRIARAAMAAHVPHGSVVVTREQADALADWIGEAQAAGFDVDGWDSEARLRFSQANGAIRSLARQEDT
jgi:hypothetical protein